MYYNNCIIMIYELKLYILLNLYKPIYTKILYGVYHIIYIIYK